MREAARAVAERRGLDEDWLNDAVKGFLGRPVAARTQFLLEEIVADLDHGGAVG